MIGMLEIGMVFDGKYKILEELGRGGMSTVYLAHNERANKTWAIKEIRKEVCIGRSFLEEVEIHRQLHHPNIVGIADFVESEDSFILVMDYIEGKDLLGVVRENGVLDPDRVVRWMKQLCDFLDYLQSFDPPVIYRDLKPANVMLKPDMETVVVVDFGTARSGKGGGEDTVCLGTRGYAAPEQFGGLGETDCRTDIYAVGTTMYHLLTGQSPADTGFEILPIGELRPSLAGSGLEEVVRICCRAKREERYQSVGELRYALDHVHDRDRWVRDADRKRLAAFAIPAVCCLAGLLAAFCLFLQRGQAVLWGYASCLERARSTLHFADAQENYGVVLSMRPAFEEGYFAILRHIERDGVLSSEESYSLSQLLRTRPAGGGGMRCEELFREENPTQYAEFRYRLGKDYFFLFEESGAGRYEYALPYLEGLEENPFLAPEKQRQAQAYYLIAKVSAGRSRGSGTGFSWTGARDGWGEVYETVTGLAGNPEKATEKCGGIGNAFAVYRMTATLVLQNTAAFLASGVSLEALTALLDAGERYVSANDGGSEDQVVREQAALALGTARKALLLAGRKTRRKGDENEKSGPDRAGFLS